MDWPGWVLNCRAFRSYVDALAHGLPERSTAPLLYRELDERLEDLMNRLERVSQFLEPDRVRPTLLARLFQRSARGREEARYRADLEGVARTVSVAELVAFLAGASKSGVLWVSTHEESFVVEFQQGDIVRAAGDRTPDGTRLGRYLVRVGAIDPDEEHRLGAEARRSGQPLGEWALDRGLVTRHQLKRALSMQAAELLKRLLSSTDAIYRFQDGADLGLSETIDLNVTQLLLENMQAGAAQAA